MNREACLAGCLLGRIESIYVPIPEGLQDPPLVSLAFVCFCRPMLGLTATHTQRPLLLIQDLANPTYLRCYPPCLLHPPISFSGTHTKYTHTYFVHTYLQTPHPVAPGGTHPSPRPFRFAPPALVSWPLNSLIRPFALIHGRLVKSTRLGRCSTVARLRLPDSAAAAHLWHPLWESSPTALLQPDAGIAAVNRQRLVPNKATSLTLSRYRVPLSSLCPFFSWTHQQPCPNEAGPVCPQSHPPPPRSVLRLVVTSGLRLVLFEYTATTAAEFIYPPCTPALPSSCSFPLFSSSFSLFVTASLTASLAFSSSLSYTSHTILAWFTGTCPSTTPLPHMHTTRLQLV